MGVLPWVIGLLIVLSCTAWIEFKHLVETTFIVSVDLSALRSDFNSKYDLVGDRAKFLFDSLKKKDTKKEVDPLLQTHAIAKIPVFKKTSTEKKELSEEFIPDEKALPQKIRNQIGNQVYCTGGDSLRLTRRVHFNELFSANEGTERKQTERKIFLRLLQRNYQSLFHLFETSKMEKSTYVIPEQILEKLLQEIVKYKELMTVKEPERLANFEFDDKNLSYIFFRMLQGGTLSSTLLKVQVPSLLSMLSTQQKKTITSVYLAPKAILSALTEDEKQVEAIIHERNQIYKKLMEKSKDALFSQDKAILQEEFASRIQGLLSPDIDTSYIDFGISKTKPSQ